MLKTRELKQHKPSDYRDLMHPAKGIFFEV